VCCACAFGRRRLERPPCGQRADPAATGHARRQMAPPTWPVKSGRCNRTVREPPKQKREETKSRSQSRNRSSRSPPRSGMKSSDSAPSSESKHGRDSRRCDSTMYFHCTLGRMRSVISQAKPGVSGSPPRAPNRSRARSYLSRARPYHNNRFTSGSSQALGTLQQPKHPVGLRSSVNLKVSYGVISLRSSTENGMHLKICQQST